MSDAWTKVVSDLADPVDKLNAITFSELKAQLVEETKRRIDVVLDEVEQDLPLSQAAREHWTQKIMALALPVIEDSIERSRLREQGQELVH